MPSLLLVLLQYELLPLLTGVWTEGAPYPTF